MNKFYFIWLLFLLFHFPSLIHSFNNSSSSSKFNESLDAIFHDHAFRVMMLRRPHTGELYAATLPPNLAGMKLSVVGLRSKTLFTKGANFSHFVIPPKTLPVPYAKRLLIVYHNLGNWSSLYYNISGYAMITPVVGFLVYDASYLNSRNLSNLELNTMGKPISVEFQDSIALKQSNRMVKCASFGDYREVLISEISSSNVCYSRKRGHFSLVVPLEKRETEKKMRPFWIMGFSAGFVGLMVVELGGAVAVRSVFGRRNQEMEREADEGEFLETCWISRSKMPRAEGTRTLPVLETTTLPNNPKLSLYA
ncbi:hypothetical protein ABFS82_01G066000 [Erythranthe guttata]|uniref:Legume lectin domain-containing protein n=2 Tax=Erythranthe guttata TaxID=4155 RepID=A0A022Q6Z4_ERYGU|nr:hypothetical protein MIMGU_mgv1a010616mg [Erythranthe guttata]